MSAHAQYRVCTFSVKGKQSLHICVTAKSNVIKYTVKYTVNQSPITHIVDSSTFYICICYQFSTCVAHTDLLSIRTKT